MVEHDSQADNEENREGGLRGHVGDAVANEYARQVDHRPSFRGCNLVLVINFAREHWKIASLLTAKI